MATRTLTGTIKTLTELPPSNRILVFELVNGGYTATANYVNSRTSVEIADNGSFSVDLWINEDSFTDSVYTCILPSQERFQFVLPTGSGSISLEDVRALGLSAADNKTLRTYIDEAVTSAIAGASFNLSRATGEAVSALRAITVQSDGLAYLANPDANAFRCLGVSLTAVASGDSVEIQSRGLLADAFFNFDMDKPVFIGSNGVLTQVVPSTGFLFKVGVPIAANTLNIDLEFYGKLA